VCSPFNRTTIQQYSDDLCAQAAQQDNSILPRGTQQLSVDGKNKNDNVFLPIFSFYCNYLFFSCPVVSSVVLFEIRGLNDSSRVGLP